MPVIRMIPTSVLWGYFAYMTINSLPGNHFWKGCSASFRWSKPTLQVLGRSPCIFRGVSAFKNNICLYDLPDCLSLDMLRHDMDTNSRGPLPAALLPYDSHQAAHTPKVF